MKNVTIFTDGACRGNPGPGGWGVLLRYDQHEKQLFGGEDNTTNNRMELLAAIKALESLRESCIIDLYTDSQYVQKGVSVWLSGWKKKNWKKADNKPVKNADLWKNLDELQAKHNITWHWVKGHSGHVENDLVDALANQGIDQHLK
ncbi:MAG: ribonuclease HI [Gammaproteobacteria bacterium]|nr:ribonuclease HI [Gammaproteobacteria bacterium]